MVERVKESQRRDKSMIEVLFGESEAASMKMAKGVSGVSMGGITSVVRRE